MLTIHFNQKILKVPPSQQNVVFVDIFVVDMFIIMLFVVMVSIRVGQNR